MKKFYSKLIIVVYVLSAFIGWAGVANAASKPAIDRDDYLQDLLARDDWECLRLLEDKGLNLPSVYREEGNTASIVQSVLSDYAAGMDVHSLPYNYEELVALAVEIDRVLPKAIPANVFSLLSSAAYVLQDSTALDTWKSSYDNYNCYGFALGKTNVYKSPGYFSGKSFSLSLSVSAMADLVIDDLDSLGYWSYKTTTKPTSKASYEKVICIAKDNTNSKDYHFMLSTGTGMSTWQHKPGTSAPLSWNYTSPGYKSWTNEGLFSVGTKAGSVTYNSTVYYIIYWAKSGPGPQPFSNADEE